MKNILIIITALCVISCGTTSVKDESVQEPVKMPEISGAWVGELNQLTTKKLPDPVEESAPMVLLNCDNVPELWLKFGEGDYRKIYEDYALISNAGNHLMSKIIDGGGWVETQSWAISAIGENRLAIQWNRMVSNPSMSSDDELRNFGQMAYGELNKVSESCDIWSK